MKPWETGFEGFRGAGLGGVGRAVLGVSDLMVYGPRV